MNQRKKWISLCLSVFVMSACIPVLAKGETEEVATQSLPVSTAVTAVTETAVTAMDTTNPTYVSILPDKKTASAGDTVHFTVKMKDEAPASVSLTLFNTQGTYRERLSSSSFVLDDTTAVFTVDWVIPTTIEPGTVYVGNYSLYDDSGNSTLGSSKPGQSLADATSITVSNPGNPDVTAPSLVSIVPNPVSAVPGETVNYTVRVRDANPSSVKLTLSTADFSYREDLSSSSFTWDGEDAVFQLSWTVPQTIVSSTVFIEYYGLDDLAGNVNQELLEIEDPVAQSSLVQVTNNSGEADNTAPVLESITPDRKTVDPGGTVNYLVKIVDVNPDSVSLQIKSDTSTYAVSLSSSDYVRVGDTASYTLSWTVPADITPGDTYVNYYGIYDRAGNSTIDSLSLSDSMAQSTIVRVPEPPTIVTETVKEVVPYPTVAEPDPTRFVGESSLKQAGVDGEADVTYDVTYQEGVELGRVETGRTVTLEPVPEIILAGSIAPYVQRLQGSDRYQTAAVISGEQFSTCETVFLTSGENYPDALAAVAYAEELHAPILLTRSTFLPDATRTEIQRLQAKNVVILGGTTAVGTAVEAGLTTMGLSTSRISGANRYETAMRIAEKMTRSGSRAFLVSGQNFADAISIAAVSAQEDTPILLSGGLALPSETRQALMDLGITEVTIIGGTSAVSANVEAELQTMGIAVNRIFGSDRYATNYEISTRYFKGTRRAFLASGIAFPDALTGALLAASKNAPVLLTATNLLSASTKTFLTENPVAGVQILGGNQAVSDTVLSAVSDIVIR